MMENKITVSDMRRTIRVALSTVCGKTDFDLDPAYEADEILRILCGISRAALFADPQKPLSQDTAYRCMEAVRQRKEGIPLAYILGSSPFFGKDYITAPGCLIPRADTEILVEEAIRLLPKGAGFWDLCTGSGCIPCAVLQNRPDVPFACGMELFPDARNIAEKNRGLHHLEERFLICSGDVLCGDLPPGKPPMLITSNPPYIRSDVCDTLDTEVQKEPRTALDGGADGMKFYRAILNNYKTALAPGGSFLFEIGYDQGEAITALAASVQMHCTIRRDYENRDRTAHIF